MSAAHLEFSKSAPLTMGVELELQLVNSRDCDLTRAASDLLSQTAKRTHPGEIKPEITESMIEISTGIHTRHAPLVAELQQIRGVLLEEASRLNIGVAGGGAHPFQHWSDRRIMDAPRMRHVSAALRLSCEAVHGLRPARAHRLRRRRRRALPAACDVALHPALHRTVGGVAVLPGRGYRVRLVAAERGVRIPAFGARAVRADLGTNSTRTSRNCTAPASSRA